MYLFMSFKDPHFCQMSNDPGAGLFRRPNCVESELREVVGPKNK
jgi:hypothetical protein